MASSIFSIYCVAENRVTASILAVLRSLSLSRIERLIGALLQQPELELVRFDNQIADHRDSVPDAEIASNFRILVETKIKEKSVDVVQLRGHLKQLEHGPGRFLLVLTPDQQQPDAIAELKDNRAVWASFSMFDQAIEELLSDKKEVTLRLAAPIKNDLRSAEGQTIAFTQGQRYVSLERLGKATTTSELVEG
jgi:hypothetical protein